jgi:hypothetical protein
VRVPAVPQCSPYLPGVPSACSKMGCNRTACSGTCRTTSGLTPPTSAPGLGLPLLHLLHPDWAHPSPICTGPGRRSFRHVQSCKRHAQCCLAGVMVTFAACNIQHVVCNMQHTTCSARCRHVQSHLTNLNIELDGLGSLLTERLSHLHRDWAHPGHICTKTGLTPATSAPGLDTR